MQLATARTLTRAALAEATGLDVGNIKQMVGDGSIPRSFYTFGDDRRSYLFCAATVALLALVRELHEHFGAQSRIPREVARQLSPDDLRRAWADGAPRQIRVTFDGVEVRIRKLGFLAVARERLEAMA